MEIANNKRIDNERTDNDQNIEEYKNQYLYLDDNFLSRDFDFCVGIESTHKIRIQLIVFSIVSSCKYVEYQKTERSETQLPFLKFAGITKDGVYCFPEFEYECIQDDAEKNEIQFRNIVIEQILSTFQISPPSSPDFFETIYRGLFVHGESQDRTVFVVIDYDKLMTLVPVSTIAPAPATQTIVWSVVDELLFEKKVLENPVEPKIINAFETRPYLWNIIYNGDYLEYFPFVLYLVVSRENHYETYSLAKTQVSALATPPKKKLISIGSKLDTYSLAEEYGERYCFTVEPISPNPSVVRYAVFTPKPKYIVDVDVDVDVGADVAAAPNLVVGGLDGSLNPVSAVAPSTLDPDQPTESYDNVPDSEKEVLEESMSEKIAYPVIYFTEKAGNLTGKYIWGIKTTDLFASL